MTDRQLCAPFQERRVGWCANHTISAWWRERLSRYFHAGVCCRAGGAMVWAGFDFSGFVRGHSRLILVATRWALIPMTILTLRWKARHPGGDLELRMKGLERLIAGY